MAARSPSTHEHLKITEISETGEEIGRGAYGSVSVVEYYGVPCAAKEVHSILLDFVGPDERKRMIESVMKECHLLSSCRHPNVISFIGIFYKKADTRDRAGPHAPVLVMELMQYSLSSLLEKYQSIPLYVKVSILYDVCAGLTYLHGRNIVHRCICSNDILLGNHLEAKIADFGAAAKIEPGKRRALTQCPGVVDFMPPEALGSQPVYGLPLDVFSYGAVIIHTITQQWPHPTAHMELNPTTGKQVLVTEVERRRKYLDIMAMKVQELVPLTSSCLKTDPKNRPATPALLLTMKTSVGRYKQANRSPVTWLAKNLLEPEVSQVFHPLATEKDIPSILRSHVLTGVAPTGQEIGHGSYGVVYEVNYNGKACAAKEVHSIFVGADGFPKMKEDFVRECHLWSTLLHPNIVQFLGVYYPPQNESGLPVLVMEKMWESLTSLAEKHSNIPLHVKLSILVDVSLGLQYLHNRVPPVIHCDLSPNNVLVGFRLEAKITDLGVAKVVKAGGSTKTMTKAPGTTDFMPPEAVADRPIYGPPLDVFSFGGIILHIITQQWPRPLSWVYIDPKTREQRLLSEVERRQPYLDQVNTPEGLHTLAASCLNGDPESRPVIKTVADKITILKDNYGKQNEIDCRDLVSWLTNKK